MQTVHRTMLVRNLCCKYGTQYRQSSLIGRALCTSRSLESIVPSSVPATQQYLGLRAANFIKVAEQACPFIRDTLTSTVTHLQPGELTMITPFKQEFVGNPVSKVLHGGVAAALIDHVGGFCAMSVVPEKHMLMATVDMRIDYMNPAPPQALVCEAKVVSVKKTLIRADVVCYNNDKSVQVAIGRALYQKYPSDVVFTDTMVEEQAHINESSIGR